MTDATPRALILGSLDLIADTAGELDTASRALTYLSDRLAMTSIQGEDPELRGLRASIICIAAALSSKMSELDSDISHAINRARAQL